MKKINELNTTVPKGSQKRFKHPTATDDPSKYMGKGEWEQYNKPQGIKFKKNKSKKSVKEMVRKPIFRYLTGEYEILDDNDRQIGIAKVKEGTIFLLASKGEADENFNGEVLSNLITHVIKDADVLNSNLSIKVENPQENKKMVRFLERYGFKSVGNGVLKRNAGSIMPISVIEREMKGGEPPRKVSWKKYQCQNCYHIDKISTNHEGPVMHHCKNCSWKMGWKGPGPEKGKCYYPLGPQCYRRFDYYGPIEESLTEATKTIKGQVEDQLDQLFGQFEIDNKQTVLKVEWIKQKTGVASSLTRSVAKLTITSNYYKKEQRNIFGVVVSGPGPQEVRKAKHDLESKVTQILTNLERTTRSRIFRIKIVNVYTDSSLTWFDKKGKKQWTVDILTTMIESDDTLKLPDIKTGDEVKVGRFKNRKAEVKGFKKDKHNQPVLKTTKGDQKLFKPRISKLEEALDVKNLKSEAIVMRFLSLWSKQMLEDVLMDVHHGHARIHAVNTGIKLGQGWSDGADMLEALYKKRGNPDREFSNQLNRARRDHLTRWSLYSRKSPKWMSKAPLTHIADMMIKDKTGFFVEDFVTWLAKDLRFTEINESDNEKTIRLKDLARVKKDMEDADFWIITHHDIDKIGKPTREYKPHSIGIKVTSTDVLDPDYLYYMFEYLHMQGEFRKLAKGVIKKQHLIVRDIRNIKFSSE